jgi:hypothetical protein
VYDDTYQHTPAAAGSGQLAWKQQLRQPQLQAAALLPALFAPRPSLLVMLLLLLLFAPSWQLLHVQLLALQLLLLVAAQPCQS